MTLPLFFFAIPEKAEATVLVESLIANQALASISLSTGYMAKSMGALEVKEFSLDTILWALVKAVASMLVRSVTKWVQSGFSDGGPLFVTDLGQFFEDAAMEASGIFIQDFLSPDVQNLLCQPWRASINLNLNLFLNRYQHPTCTLDTIISNAEGMAQYMTDFQYGGWPAWISMTQTSTNNPVGLYLMESMNLSNKMAAAEEKANTTATMNSGFLGARECLKWQEITGPVDPENPPKQNCLQWGTISPGKWIESTLSQNTGFEIQTLALADELSELVGALAGQLMSWAMNGLSNGLRDGGAGTAGRTLPGPINSPPAAAPKAATQNISSIINRDTNAETTYVNTLQQTVSAYQQASSIYQETLIGFTKYQKDLKNPPENMVASGKDQQTNIDSTASQIAIINNNVIPSLNNQIASSNNITAQLQALTNQVNAATTATELQNLYDQFTALSQNTHTPYQQSQAEQALDDAKDVIANAQEQRAYFQTLPQPPYTAISSGNSSGGIQVGGEGNGDSGGGTSGGGTSGDSTGFGGAVSL